VKQAQRHPNNVAIIQFRMLRERMESKREALIRFRVIIMEDNPLLTEPAEPSTMNKLSDPASTNSQYHQISTILITT
jgi:hypothetical protein